MLISSCSNRLRMPTSKRRRVSYVLSFCMFFTVCFATLYSLNTHATGGEQVIFERGRSRDACHQNAEGRILSFVNNINGSCDDPQRQRVCQERLSSLAIPRLLNSSLAVGCDAGCLFHAVISEAGGKTVNQLAFSAFLRAFIVTQPVESKLYIWSLPWDNIELPDITQGCSVQNLNVKLADGRWRTRILLQKIERAALGTSNLLKMTAFWLVGNDFRLLRSMVRLSDLLRFHLLQKHGGIYIDSDVLLLRDLSPLCNSTFTYQWSDKDAENSAVFGCPKNCRFVNEYIQSAGTSPLAYHPLKWRRVGRHNVRRWPVRLPTMLFDPVWLKQIGSDTEDPAKYLFTKHEDFVKAGVADIHIKSRYRAFPASLAYHWHGGFAAIPESQEAASTFSQLHSLACSWIRH